MTVKFYHNPYDAVSRAKLEELNQSGANIGVEDYTYIAADRSVWVSSLPTAILFDDDGKTELCRAEHPDHITNDNIMWMHTQHADWKAKGRPNLPDALDFATPPWHGQGPPTTGPA